MMDNQQKSEQVKGVVDLTAAAGWDTKPISLAHEIMGFLESVKDEGTSIDSGTDGTTGDLWVKIQGVEYFIQVGKSRGQLVKEGKSDPSEEFMSAVDLAPIAEVLRRFL